MGTISARIPDALEEERLDLAAPDDVGIYDSDVTTIASDDEK
ncbi:hypothetical protein [Natronobacterium gregoryi]|uniref:Uncharacterized protein n=2 Tax=Natronobacterium gregoryi TaxID=44930 RepID=L0AJN4_NATGS|nr:hypothetical protein [Natronobacterium gregoryi]AFZ73639.1 hypothetical protein Natgr_2474 [Natronobacterium gregoryi SP2]SFJ00027.1 hypothetical protein SAMN05443661_1113 [Natronobacterium gregoryi]